MSSPRGIGKVETKDDIIDVAWSTMGFIGVGWTVCPPFPPMRSGGPAGGQPRGGGRVPAPDLHLHLEPAPSSTGEDDEHMPQTDRSSAATRVVMGSKRQHV